MSIFYFNSILNNKIFNISCSFIDVPIESCGQANPLRVALQASNAEVLLILLRYGANPYPKDDGSNLVIALLDKLLEYESGDYPQQLITCLRILLSANPVIDLPFKVRRNIILVLKAIATSFVVFLSPLSTKYVARCA